MALLLGAALLLMTLLLFADRRERVGVQVAFTVSTMTLVLMGLGSGGCSWRSDRFRGL